MKTEQQVLENVIIIRRNLLTNGWNLAIDAVELADVKLSVETLDKSPQEVAYVTKQLLVTFLRQHCAELVEVAVTGMNKRDGLQ